MMEAIGGLNTLDMPLKDYIQGKTNRIVIGSATAVGLIIAGAAGIATRTPAYQIHNSSGQNTWGVDIEGRETASGAYANKTLISCDTIDSTSTGMLLCGTDSAGGGGISTGNILTISNKRYVSVQGDTMTGGLLIHSVNDDTKTVDSGILFEVAGVGSGRQIHAHDQLSSSGSLSIDGVSRFGNPDTADTSADVLIATTSAIRKGLVIQGYGAQANVLFQTQISTGTPTFQISAGGNLTMIDSVEYDWPNLQGGASTVLTNDGAGGLSWASPASSNSFETIAIPAGTNPVADSSADTLTFTETSPLIITGDAATDIIDITWSSVDLGPDGTIQAGAVELTTDTTGNYAAGDAEAGAALTGDSATGFFAAGLLEIARGGTNAGTDLNNSRIMVSSGSKIVESYAITDGESIQRNNTTFISAPLPLGTVEGRLTLTSGTPITTADVTGATTIYFTPYKGNRIYLYDGTRWKLYSFTELSLALGTLTNALPYDVFIYDNSGTLTLESLAWTNGTTRATALTTQNGVYVKTGATTRRYLGTFYTSSTTATEDSASKRFVWNYYNRVERYMYATDSTDSWTYTTASWRESNGASSPGVSRVDYVVGWEEDLVSVRAEGKAYNSVATITISSGVGIDSSTVNSAQMIGNGISTTYTDTIPATYEGYPGIGYHSIRQLEYAQSGGTTTWFGDAGTDWFRSGMVVKIKG